MGDALSRHFARCYTVQGRNVVLTGDIATDDAVWVTAGQSEFANHLLDGLGTSYRPEVARVGPAWHPEIQRVGEVFRFHLPRRFDLVTRVNLPAGARLIGLESFGRMIAPIDLASVAIPTEGFGFGAQLHAVFDLEPFVRALTWRGMPREQAQKIVDSVAPTNVVVGGRYATSQRIRDALASLTVWTPFGDRWLRTADGMCSVRDQLEL